VQVLVTGGNGFVGNHLVRALLARGDSVRVLALAHEDTSTLESLGVAVHRGDITHADSLTGSLRGVDAVVHLAAMMHVWRPLADYRRVNVAGTRNVCQGAIAAGVGRVVHMSSSSVYGMDWDHAVGEECALSPFRDPYPITKAEGDALVQRMIVRDGLPAVILRPDQIFGPGDRLHFGHMADRVRAGRSFLVGRGDNRLPLVYVSDMVQALLLALDRKPALGQAFNVSAEMPLTQRGLFEAIAEEVGGKPPRFDASYRSLYAAATIAEWVAKLTRTSRRPPLTRLGVAFMGSDVRYSIRKAQHLLGYVPATSLREGVRRAAVWYLETDRSKSAIPALEAP
jgi:nucleoside-diphosphate-sugar epimerase